MMFGLNNVLAQAKDTIMLDQNHNNFSFANVTHGTNV
jgi:hypothetical protein